MEAEFIACYKATNHAIWLQNFVIGLQVVDGIERPLKVYCDNRSITEFSNNNGSSEASKHIDIKYLVVIERVQNQIVSIEHIGTNFMLEYPLTKVLTIIVQ